MNEDSKKCKMKLPKGVEIDVSVASPMVDFKVEKFKAEKGATKDEKYIKNGSSMRPISPVKSRVNIFKNIENNENVFEELNIKMLTTNNINDTIVDKNSVDEDSFKEQKSKTFNTSLKNKANNCIKNASLNISLDSESAKKIVKGAKRSKTMKKKLHLKENNFVSTDEPLDILSCRFCKIGFKSLSHFNCHTCKGNTNKEQLKITYQCEFCDMTFMQEYHLKKHLLGHKRNNCKLCSAQFTKRKLLCKHLKLVHDVSEPIRLYYCSFCKKGFATKLLLHHHLKVHANGRPLCLKCGYMCDSEDEYNDHLKEHDQSNVSKFVCTLCCKQFLRKQQYDQHMVGHERYSCSMCSTNFPNKAQLVKHQSCIHGYKVIKKNHKCQVCDKSFNRPKNLLIHQQIHTGEKPVQCSHCEKNFRNQRALAKHMTTVRHLEKISKEDGKPVVVEKRFLCEECGAKFYQQTSLLRHIEITHGSAELLKCHYCDYSTTYKANLKRHEELHTDIKRFICELCGSSFHALASLKDHHAYVHSEDRNFICPLCDKGFKGKSTLQRHMKIHSEARPYKCHCNRDYKRMSHLKRHMASVHNMQFKQKQVEKINVSLDEEVSIKSHQDIPSSPSLAETLEILQDHSSCDDFPLLLSTNGDCATNQMKDLINVDVSVAQMSRASESENFITVPSEIMQAYLNQTNEQIISVTTKGPLMSLMVSQGNNHESQMKLEGSELNISPTSYRTFHLSTSPLSLIPIESTLTDALGPPNPLDYPNLSSVHETHIRPHSLPNLNLQNHESNNDSADSFPQFSLHGADSPTSDLSIPSFLLNNEMSVSHPHVSDMDLTVIDPMSPPKQLFGVSSDTLELSTYTDSNHLADCKVSDHLSEDSRHRNIWVSTSDDNNGVKSTNTDVLAISNCSRSTVSPMSSFTLLPQTLLFQNDSLLSCSSDTNSLNSEEFETLAGLC